MRKFWTGLKWGAAPYFILFFPLHAYRQNNIAEYDTERLAIETLLLFIVFICFFAVGWHHETKREREEKALRS